MNTVLAGKNSKGLYGSLMKTFWEYLLIVLPVGIYVVIQAVRENCYGIILTSPEWSIAVIFLAFQGLSLYVDGALKSGLRIYSGFYHAVALIALLLVVSASINAYLVTGRAFRIVLLAFSSVYFFFLVAPSKFLAARLRK